MKLDALDMKILAALDADARSPESSIAKTVGTSKQVVKYRIDKLAQNRIIENFYTVIDVGRLGFDSYYVFLQLTGLNSEEENELYKDVVELPYISWLVTGIGRWDCVMLFCAQSISEFNSQLNDLKKRLGHSMHELTFTSLIVAEHISYKFLKTASTKAIRTNPKYEICTLDDTEKRILKVLDRSARMPVTDLAKNARIPLHVAHYKLKQMKQTMIEGFKPKINVQRLGIQWHLVLIAFNTTDQKRIDRLIAHCKENKHIYYVTNTVGKYNLMLDVHVRDTQEFRAFLFDLKNQFGDVILLYESMVVFEELYLSYVPPILLRKILK